MSELKFKAYGELEISEALSDASHVIIEENGDVKRFPANSIGKVKTVNGAEPDENGNVAVEIPAPVQPDLSQNDPEAPDYVKGLIRQESLPDGYPYKVLTEVERIEEQSYSCVYDAGQGMAMCSEPFPVILETNKVYDITFDGKTYRCYSRKFFESVAIGNLVGAGEPDTGEPFCIITQEPDDYTSLLTYDTADATHNVSVVRYDLTTTKLAERFIPDSIPKTYIVNIDENGVPDTESATIEKYYDDGYMVFCRYPGFKSNITLPMLCYDGNGAHFSGYVYDNAICDLVRLSIRGNNAKVEVNELFTLTLTRQEAFQFTATNGKKYILDVDDSDTLTATEVTE